MGSTRSKFSFVWYGSVQMLFRIRDEAFSMLGFGSFSRVFYEHRCCTSLFDVLVYENESD